MISMLRELLTFLGAHFYLAPHRLRRAGAGGNFINGAVRAAKRRPAAGARDRPRLRAGAADAAGTGGAGGRGVSVAAPERFAAALCGGDLTAVLGVGVDTLRNDLAAVLMQLQTPEEGRRF